MQKNRKVMIVGAGTMGHGIAQVYAMGGYPTVLVDNQESQIKKAASMVDSNLKVLQSEGLVSPEEEQALERNLTYSTDLRSAASGVGMVVEAIPENPQFKIDLFKELDGLVAPDTILASTTSVLNIYQFIQVSHPERLIITHWCNPAHIVPLVEIVLGPETAEATLDTVKGMLIGLHKVPVVLKECIPGFLVNRLNAALAREAGYIVSQGWASPEDVDAAFSTNAALKSPFEGPLELNDYIGWDTATLAGKYLYPQLCNSTVGMEFADDMVAKGWLGVKSGRGIKDYAGRTREEVQDIRNRKILKVAKLARELRG